MGRGLVQPFRLTGNLIFRFLLALGGLLGLYLLGLQNYLFFHSLSEIFSVVIAFSIFILAWNSREFLENGYLLFVGIVFLYVGILDVLHTFTYEGVNILSGHTANLPTQLWLAARFLQATAMLFAPLFLRRRISPYATLILYAAVTLLLILSIFTWRIFPSAYIPNVGLTVFKKVSEIIVIALLIVSAGLLWLNRDHFDSNVVRELLVYLGFSALSEAAFTQYVGVYGPANAIGHLFKIVSIYFLYKALVETGLVKPYDILFRNLKMREVELEHELLERRRIEEALRMSESRLRRLAEANIIGVMYSNAQGEITDANQALLDMIGYTREDLKAGRIQWREMTPPDFLPLDEKAIQEAGERGACTPYEKEYIRKDGSQVPILIGFACLETPGDYIAFVVDLTRQKEAEASLEEYASKLEQSNSELENFAFVASHDLQEPLRKIQTFGGRLSERSSERLTGEEKDYLARMLNAASRMRSMIDDLLALSRVTTQAQPFTKVDLQQVAAEVLNDLEIRIERSGGEVIVDALPVIDADPLQMRQLIQNLVANALKFHRPDSTPWVHVNATMCGSGRKETIELRVQDHGIGLDMAYADRIFQPFQRLHGKNEFEGSGVGLAICRKIVERHGGQIRVESIPDQGTTFIVILPAHQEDGQLDEEHETIT